MLLSTFLHTLCATHYNIVTRYFRVFYQILDENDNAPVFLHPVTPTSTSGENNASENNADVLLWNRATSGHVIVTVTASDPDDGTNSDVEYSLIAGNADHLFSIDRKLGDVTLSRNLRGSVDDQVRPTPTGCGWLGHRWVCYSCRLRGPKSVRSGNGLPLLALCHLVSLPLSTPLRIVNRSWSCSCKWRYINVGL